MELAGAKAWILSDGKAGHETQCRGVAAALGIDAEIKRISESALALFLAPWGRPALKDRVGRPGSSFGPPWPDLVIAAGRRTIPYLRAIRRLAGPRLFSVVLMDPRVSLDVADLIWLPEHDLRRGPNVIVTPVVPHSYSEERLTDLRAHMPEELRALPHPRFAILVGGPNSTYRFDDDECARLARTLDKLAMAGVGLMVTASRRTPEALTAAINELVNYPNVHIWDGEGDNPYPFFIANADAFVITADSVSMVCEAASTGRPIHIFSPRGGNKKFDRFHANLRALGATRVVPDNLDAGIEPLLANWQYTPPLSAPLIADEIRRRWQASQKSDS